jgi:hypothetical protein
MPYREFLDSAEVLWRVWATLPTVGKILSKGFENGWLTFESGSERKRLAPIPKNWESFSDAKLRTLLKTASPARTQPSSNGKIIPSGT